MATLHFEFDSNAPNLQTLYHHLVKVGDETTTTMVWAMKFINGARFQPVSPGNCEISARCISHDDDMLIFRGKIVGPRETLEIFRQDIARWYGNSGDTADITNIEKWSDIDGPWPRG